MSREYDLYLVEHKANVMKGFNWLCEHIFKGNDGLYINDALDKLAFTITDHDNSKYEPAEYDAYDAYFYGDDKPRKVIQENFDRAWLHHIHENPHHWQYWVLINDDADLGTVALKMPPEHVIEMICDWWSFSWKSGNLYEIFSWYEKNKDHIILNVNTRDWVEDILGLMRKALDEEKEK